MKSSHEVIDTVNVADVESISYGKRIDPRLLTVLMKDGKRIFCDEVCPVQEEPVSEDFEEALAREWQGYNDSGAVTVDALEDNTQELTFAKGFYRGAKWQEAKDQETIETAIHHAYHNGRLEMKEQMMKDVMPCVLEWYDGFVLNFTEEQLNDVVTKNNINIGDKVKLIVIKED